MTFLKLCLASGIFYYKSKVSIVLNFKLINKIVIDLQVLIIYCFGFNFNSKIEINFINAFNKVAML